MVLVLLAAAAVAVAVPVTRRHRLLLPRLIPRLLTLATLLQPPPLPTPRPPIHTPYVLKTEVALFSKVLEDI